MPVVVLLKLYARPANAVEATEKIAMKKAAAGEFEKAFEISAALVEPSHALGVIACHLTAAKREPEARLALGRIEYAAAKVGALQSIAEYYERENQIYKTFEYRFGRYKSGVNWYIPRFLFRRH